MRTRLTLLFIAIISNLIGQPNPRHLEEIAFDPVRNKLVVYGGVENHEGKWVESSRLFELGGNGWQKFDEPGPGNRRAAAMAFDEVGKETLVIGGVRYVGGTDSVLFDMWSWDGKRWKLLDNNCPLKEPRAAFNSDTGRLLVYGVANNKTVIDYSGEQIYELWEFGLGKWSKLSGDGPNERPAQMAYDRERKALVIPAFEDGEATVWEWKSEAWTKIGCQSQCPVGRTRFAFGYSVSDEASYLFGGLDFERKQLGDFWKWKGSQWERVEVTTGPSVRNSAHFASANDRLFLYGGTVPNPESPGQIVISNELWLWENGSWSTAQY